LTQAKICASFEGEMFFKEPSMIIPVDRNLSLPLYKQIVDRIKGLIDQGVVAPASRLPSSRRLAQKLGVNRTTVYQAYEELQAQGYLQSRPGSYNIVQKRIPEAPYNPQAGSSIRWSQVSSGLARRLYETFSRYSPEKPARPVTKTKPIDLASLDPDERLHPVKDFRKCVDVTLEKRGAETLKYGAHQGYFPLREYLAQRLRLHGVSTSAEEILITNGAQQAIDLVSRMLSVPGRTVVIEAPTYANLLPLLRFNGAVVQTVPMREDGMDLEFLDRILAAKKVSFVYTMPNFQNPTGITTTHEHRERLLALCSRARVPIVEDGFEEDMKYYGKVDLPVKSIDHQNLVIYIGTFSKALFPGLRVGWITADAECIRRLLAVKRFSDLGSGSFVQAVLHTFCQFGYYEIHLRRLHRIYRKRMDAALRAMEECMPSGIRWTRPLGGYTIWVRIPKRLSEEEFRRAVYPFGVLASPGTYYFPRQRRSEFMRLSIASLNEEEIREGISRLGSALKTLTASP
jgi:DNA-binding transcriptional MocR family regulator